MECLMAADGQTIFFILGGLAVLGFVFMRTALPGVRARAMQGGERRGGALMPVIMIVVAALGYYWYRRYG